MKMWDGRFTEKTAELMDRFNASLPFDQRMISEDVDGSIAWARALHKIGIYSSEQLNTIVQALRQIEADYIANRLQFLPTDEDIHMAIERVLTDRVGAIGARLHTGRSRNDQVATDFRMWTLKQLRQIQGLITELQRVLVARSEKEKTIILSGYTHLQQAQPIVLSHYWLSFLFALEREKNRLDSAISCCDMLVLGSGALAGSGFAIDRQALAADLGFSRVSPNSLDGVMSRDFALEALSCLSSLGIVLSRYAEDLIMWSSVEFGYVQLSDAYSTGSSMMPQKKNPDSLELIRGKTGRLIGNYTRLATTLKGLGTTYFKDLQEDKEGIFDSVDTVEMTLRVFTGVVESLRVSPENMQKRLDPLLLATDVADYLVAKGVAFRQAHEIVGKIVHHVITNKISLLSLPVEEFKKFSDKIQDDIVDILSWDAAIAHRNIEGGTGIDSVERQIQQAHELIG